MSAQQSVFYYRKQMRLQCFSYTPFTKSGPFQGIKKQVLCCLYKCGKHERDQLKTVFLSRNVYRNTSISLI